MLLIFIMVFSACVEVSGGWCMWTGGANLPGCYYTLDPRFSLACLACQLAGLLAAGFILYHLVEPTAIY